MRQSRLLIKRAEFEAFSLEELPRDSYVKVGDSFWHPRVETTVNGLMEDLDQVGVTGLIEELSCCIMKYRDSIASWLKGATGPLCKGKRSTSYGYVNLFTKAQGLHTMLLSHNKPAEAAKLVEPLVQAYFEQISGTWLGPASTKLIKCRLDENDRVHWHIREEDKGRRSHFSGRQSVSCSNTSSEWMASRRCARISRRALRRSWRQGRRSGGQRTPGLFGYARDMDSPFTFMGSAKRRVRYSARSSAPMAVMAKVGGTRHPLGSDENRSDEMLREQDAESASWGLEKLLKMQGHKAELKLLNKSVLEVQKLARQWDGEEDDEEMEEAELVQPDGGEHEGGGGGGGGRKCVSA